MPILMIAGLLLVLVVLLGPQWWIGRVLARHGGDRPDLPGTGAELARHLLDEAGLGAVNVELTDKGDHYDPQTHTVRLLQQHFDGRSVAAVAVAAHEVSHALQHARAERAFALRIDLARRLHIIDRLASVIIFMAPILFIVVKIPGLFLLQLGAGVLLLAVHVVVHLVTLPVEFDASFNKALPALAEGRYLEGPDLSAARDVLSAAAWTYVAGALMTLLDVARLFRVLRI